MLHVRRDMADECRFCEEKGTHTLDDETYCCKHFDEVIEHSGNIKHLGWAPANVAEQLKYETLKTLLKGNEK